jgi:hypothetical protein
MRVDAIDTVQTGATTVQEAEMHNTVMMFLAERRSTTQRPSSPIALAFAFAYEPPTGSKITPAPRPLVKFDTSLTQSSTAAVLIVSAAPYSAAATSLSAVRAVAMGIAP